MRFGETEKIQRSSFLFLCTVSGSPSAIGKTCHSCRLFRRSQPRTLSSLRATAEASSPSITRSPATAVVHAQFPFHRPFSFIDPMASSMRAGDVDERWNIVMEEGVGDGMEKELVGLGRGEERSGRTERLNEIWEMKWEERGKNTGEEDGNLKN